MRNPRVVVAATLLPLVLASACSKTTSPKGSVTVHARFLNGATPAGVSPSARRSAASALQTAAAPANGEEWLLSPDRVTMTLTHIRLQGTPGTADGGTGSDVNCVVTYDKSKPGLTQLDDCTFLVPAGTFNVLNLTFSPTYQVVISDAVSGFYSTATGIVTAAPSGGAQPLTVTVADAASQLIPLPNDIVVTDTAGTPASVSIVINALQFFRVALGSGAVTLRPIFRPDLVGTVGSLAAVEYYVSQALGTAGSYCAGQCQSPVKASPVAVAVYYTGPTTPSAMGMIPGGVAPTCTWGGSGSFVNDRRGYQGLDASGNLGWAMAADTTWKNYVSEWRMTRLTTTGATTTLFCKNRSTDPAPAGGSYASGAPAIATAANTVGSYMLVAK